jgi:hypothetical protein
MKGRIVQKIVVLLATIPTLRLLPGSFRHVMANSGDFWQIKFFHVPSCITFNCENLLCMIDVF